MYIHTYIHIYTYNPLLDVFIFMSVKMMERLLGVKFTLL